MNLELDIIKILIEVFGYIGTALVILSMLMTSVLKLRVLNICGSVVSAVYAAISGAYPVVLLNVTLIAVNVFQLIRMRRKKSFHHVSSTAADPNLAYLLELYRGDIKAYYPEYAVREDAEVHFVYHGSEIVGFLVGKREEDLLQIEIDYATPGFRDLSVSGFLYECLKEEGVAVLATSVKNEYFLKMGFCGEEILLKKL